MRIDVFLFAFLKDVSPMSEGDRLELQTDAGNWFKKLKMPEEGEKPQNIYEWIAVINNFWLFRTILALAFTPLTVYWKNLGVPAPTEVNPDDDDDLKELLL